MIYHVEISPDAENDLSEAYNWYEEKAIELGNKFRLQVEAIIVRLLQNPKQFMIRYDNIRIAFLAQFPYGIHFAIEQNTILILAVFHTSRDSNQWEY